MVINLLVLYFNQCFSMFLVGEMALVKVGWCFPQQHHPPQKAELMVILVGEDGPHAWATSKSAQCRSPEEGREEKPGR